MHLRLVGVGQEANCPDSRQEGEGQENLSFALHLVAKALDALAGTVRLAGVPPDSGNVLRLAAASTNTIGEAVDAWLSNLATRGKRPGTIKSYRTLLKSAAPELGWLTVADITAESVMAWAGHKRQSGAWTGTTMNRQVGALQSLSRFLAKKKWLAVDPLLSIDRAEDDGGDGARAATSEEARALIRHAWERQQIDRRAVGNRALVWQCMFTMGLRASEPAAFRWECLHLDESVPFVRWTRGMHKAFRPCEVAICVETSELLRLHRATVPSAPDDQVFPVLPPRVTFRKDRDAAGISAYDRRGRGFSPHSARKWFSHVLTVAGVEGRVIDTLMRHSTGTPGRYPDLLPKDQAPFLALLPKLWPGNLSTVDAQMPQVPQGQSDEKNLRDFSDSPVANHGENAEYTGVTLGYLSISDSPTRSAVQPSVTSHARRAGDSEPKGEHSAGSAQQRCSKVPTSGYQTLDSTSDRLSAIHKTLDIAAEALRQLRGPALLLCLAACGVSQHKTEPVPATAVAEVERAAPVIAAEVRER